MGQSSLAEALPTWSDSRTGFVRNTISTIFYQEWIGDQRVNGCRLQTDHLYHMMQGNTKVQTKMMIICSVTEAS